jgi:hypothetical protein
VPNRYPPNPDGRGATLYDLRRRQNPHRAADTPEHTEREDDHAGNQPQRREGWYGNPVGLIHGKPPFRTAGSPDGPVGTLCLKRKTVNYIKVIACAMASAHARCRSASWENIDSRGRIVCPRSRRFDPWEMQSTFP